MGRLSSDAGISLTGTIGTVAGLAVSCLAVWIAYQTMRRRGASRNDFEVRMVEFIATQIGININTPRYVCHIPLFPLILSPEMRFNNLV
jgi:O-antigen ligase